MNTTTKTLIAAIFITLISGTAAAALIEPDWPMDKPNERLYPSDVFIDFEDGIQNEWPVSNVTGVKFLDYNGFSWVYAEKAFAYMNIFPDCRYPEEAYVVNGRFGAFTCWMRIPYHTGVIQFDGGATQVSVLASTSCYLRMSAYDKTGKLIESSGTAEPNAGTLTFTRMTVSSSNPDIKTIIITGLGSHWIIDDLVISGLTFPDTPVDYTYVARRAQELHGVDYLEYGLGHDYLMMAYMDAWQFTDGAMGEYWNPETKQFEEGEGISNAGLILWAYNYDADDLAGTSFVKRNTVEGMEKHDFKVPVESEDTQPGDVYFMDRDFDGTADVVGMVIETTPTDMDLIYSCEDEGIGVIYSKKSIVEGSPAFMGYKRLPGVIRGGKNPIPKGH